MPRFAATVLASLVLTTGPALAGVFADDSAAPPPPAAPTAPLPPPKHTSNADPASSTSTCATASAGATATAPAPAPAVASSIGTILKVHNIDAGGGSLGVRIVVPTHLVGVKGQTVAAVVWFYDAAGQPVSSALSGFGDASNQLRVMSRDYVPTTPIARKEFEVRVPYAAFPRTAAGRHLVEARAVLVQRVGDGRRVLARNSTTFFVE